MSESLWNAELQNGTIPHVHFRIGNNSIPLTDDDTDSYWSMVSKMETCVNTLIDKCNELILLNQPMNEKYTATLESIKQVQSDLDKFTKEFQIPDKTIGFEKLKDDFKEQLENYCIKRIGTAVKTVKPILYKGRICFIIPRTWDDLIFYTDEQKRLCIKIPRLIIDSSQL